MPFNFYCTTTDNKTEVAMEWTLLEKKVEAPSCGINSIWLGLKFKNKAKDTVVGLVHCPDMYESTFFEFGKSYSVIATKSIVFKKNEAVINIYSQQKIPLYKVISIEIK